MQSQLCQLSSKYKIPKFVYFFNLTNFTLKGFEQVNPEAY